MKKAWVKINSLSPVPYLLFLIFYSFLTTVTTAFAQSGNSGNPGGPTGGNTGNSGNISLSPPLGGNCNDLTCPAQKIIDFLFTIAIPLCAIMVIVGGFQMLTAAGDPAKFSNGRKTILYAAGGFAVILIAGGVATLIRNTLGGS